MTTYKMTTNNHTPGPWRKVDVRGHLRVYGKSPEEPLCVFFMGETDDWQGFKNANANATLIAAAPDLLAALDTLVKSLVDADEEGLIEHAAEIIQARAAIAKARGDTK